MLDFSVKTWIDFLTWIRRDALGIAPLPQESITRIIDLSEKYSDIPMDFADATLFVISEMEKIQEIISIDPDFYIYRNIRNEYREYILKLP